MKTVERRYLDGGSGAIRSPNRRTGMNDRSLRLAQLPSPSASSSQGASRKARCSSLGRIGTANSNMSGAAQVCLMRSNQPKSPSSQA